MSNKLHYNEPMAHFHCLLSWGFFLCYPFKCQDSCWSPGSFINQCDLWLFLDWDLISKREYESKKQVFIIPLLSSWVEMLGLENWMYLSIRLYFQTSLILNFYSWCFFTLVVNCKHIHIRTLKEPQMVFLRQITCCKQEPKTCIMSWFSLLCLSVVVLDFKCHIVKLYAFQGCLFLRVRALSFTKQKTQDECLLNSPIFFLCLSALLFFVIGIVNF